jgi:TM2 domain-containing membrane protein YozV
MTWSTTKTNEPRGDSTMATWLGWIIPGAGHLYLGAPILAAVAFLLVMGLFFAGIRLSNGMVFEFLDADLRGPIAGALTPEVGNLAGLVYYIKAYGFGPGFMRSWPEHIHLASWLMATSGFLNVVFVVHAGTLARMPKDVMPRAFAPASQVLAGWLVPGLGHLMQGRRRRALMVFVMLVGLFVVGTVLAEGSNLDRERHFYYWSGQFMAGAPVMLLEALHGHARVTHDIRYADAGLVFGCLAGLLNILCLLDVQAFGARRALEEATQRPLESAPVAGAAA